MPWIVVLECPKIIPAFLGGKGPTMPVGAFFASPTILKVTSKQEAGPVLRCLQRARLSLGVVWGEGVVGRFGDPCLCVDIPHLGVRVRGLAPGLHGGSGTSAPLQVSQRGFPASRTWTGIG